MRTKVGQTGAGVIQQWERSEGGRAPASSRSTAVLPEVNTKLTLDHAPLDHANDDLRGNGSHPGVTVVVPCFNEEPALPALRQTLARARRKLAEHYNTRVILVDDGSTDGTWPLLRQLFGTDPDCELVQHRTNQGIAAAIATGIRRARTEIVCSIDCDCTYDPDELVQLVPELKDGVDLVTGSPYHPAGRVENGVGWRILLSRIASALYRGVLRQKLHTYTSCFRVYRRSAVVNLAVERKGFLGVAELLAKLDLEGGRIVECPATLRARTLGVSKMNKTKMLRTIVGHLELLGSLLVRRFVSAADRSGRPPKNAGAGVKAG